MKADRKNYKGIEYVQFNELPQTQQDKLTLSVGPAQFIKILVDGKIIGQCLQYKDYSAWYESVYKVKTAPPALKESRASESIEITPNLAMNKF
jgi:hypothetical protein